MYSSNVSFHSVSFNGGIEPINRLQLTIDRPESVSLVIPPTITIINIRKKPELSQNITDLSFCIETINLGVKWRDHNVYNNACNCNIKPNRECDSSYFFMIDKFFLKCTNKAN